MLKLSLQRLPISSRLAILAVLIVGVAVAASVGVSLRAAEKAMRERAQSSLTVNINLLRDILLTKGEPRLQDGQLVFGSEGVNNNFAAVDKVKALSGGTATVFMGDTRVTTNVTKPDGTRAVGTKLAQGPAHDAVFKEKRTYSGAADILGVPYFTIYEPIVQKSDGNVIGILYVGIKQEEFLAVTGEMLRDNIIAGLTIAAIAAALLFWLVRRMIKPLGMLSEALRRLAEGDLATPGPAFSGGSEFGAMAKAVEVLHHASVEKTRLEQDAAAQAELMGETRRQTEEQRQAATRQQAEQAQELERIVEALAQGLASLSQGDLRYRIEAVIPAAYAQLRDNFNETVDRLSDTVATIQTTSADVGLAAREIHMGADDLSKRTEEQASSLEETAATTEELAASVKASAQASKDAARIADEA
ncbi:MAG: methyl-accepting chemotaxis protein, partial [Hyphomicrobiales bacterium]